MVGVVGLELDGRCASRHEVASLKVSLFAGTWVWISSTEFLNDDVHLGHSMHEVATSSQHQLCVARHDCAVCVQLGLESGTSLE